MKCCKCGVEHDRFKDFSKTKPASYCRACHAAYMREHRPKHSELPSEARRRANVRSHANVYKRRGLIEPAPCQQCGAEAEMHHDDYRKPTDVRWLCRPCHLAEHRACR